MRTTWLAVLGVAAVLVVLLVWQSRRAEMTVRVLSPRVETIRAYVEEQAVTALPRDYLVSMPIAGWLQPITLREGDRVAAGETLARLDTEDLRDRVTQSAQRVAVLETKIAETRDHRLEENALIEIEATVKAIDETVRAAEAKLEAAAAVRDFAEGERERLLKIAESEGATTRELREADMTLRKAQAEYQSDRLDLAALKTIAAVSYIGPKFMHDYIDRKSFTLQQHEQELIEARVQLEIERRNLARAEVTAPIDGVVLERHQTRRQYLAAGTPLVTIGRLEDLEVIAEVLTERATRIEVGDAVEVFGQALPDGPVTGRVLRVYPQGFRKVSSLGVEQQRVNVAIGFGQPVAGLGVDYRVFVRIIHAEAEDALTIPRTALFRGDEGGQQVLVVRDGRVQRQAVRVGLANDERAQVVEGLTSGAAVVARPSNEIRIGMRVAAESGN